MPEKFDAGKPAYDLIPPEFLDGLAEVLGHGAEKYGAHNWWPGMRWGLAPGVAGNHVSQARWRGAARD
jgi:hypothetical protein